MVNGFARTIKCNITLSRSEQRFWGRTWPSANILEEAFQEQGRNPVPLGMGGCQAGDSENPLNNPLWCRVTRIEDNVLTLFVENGHWNFQLDAKTNRSLEHEVISNFKGSVVIHSTYPAPFKHGSIYNQAIDYYHQSFQVENGLSPK